ncbi:MAG: hypothetical protein AB7F75_04795 [Planctomycetota bacterium]
MSLSSEPPLSAQEVPKAPETEVATPTDSTDDQIRSLFPEDKVVMIVSVDSVQEIDFGIGQHSMRGYSTLFRVRKILRLEGGAGDQWPNARNLFTEEQTLSLLNTYKGSRILELKNQYIELDSAGVARENRLQTECMKPGSTFLLALPSVRMLHPNPAGFDCCWCNMDPDFNSTILLEWNDDARQNIALRLEGLRQHIKNLSLGQVGVRDGAMAAFRADRELAVNLLLRALRAKGSAGKCEMAIALAELGRHEASEALGDILMTANQNDFLKSMKALEKLPSLDIEVANKLLRALGRPDLDTEGLMADATYSLLEKNWGSRLERHWGPSPARNLEGWRERVTKLAEAQKPTAENLSKALKESSKPPLRK